MNRRRNAMLHAAPLAVLLQTLKSRLARCPALLDRRSCSSVSSAAQRGPLRAAEMSQPLPAGLKELLTDLEDYAPAVPDEITQHAMRQGGYECKDVRTVRLISVAAQRFLAQVLEEAHNAHKLRQMAPAAKLKEAGYDPKDKRDLLTAEDLAKGMEECGVKASRAPYWKTNKPQ